MVLQKIKISCSRWLGVLLEVQKTSPKDQTIFVEILKKWGKFDNKKTGLEQIC
jgi:hypothetical protein